MLILKLFWVTSKYLKYGGAKLYFSFISVHMNTRVII